MSPNIYTMPLGDASALLRVHEGHRWDNTTDKKARRKDDKEEKQQGLKGRGKVKAVNGAQR